MVFVTRVQGTGSTEKEIFQKKNARTIGINQASV